MYPKRNTLRERAGAAVENTEARIARQPQKLLEQREFEGLPVWDLSSKFSRVPNLWTHVFRIMDASVDKFR